MALHVDNLILDRSYNQLSTYYNLMLIKSKPNGLREMPCCVKKENPYLVVLELTF